jgi:ubiquitin-conjugating enzyme E2 A
MSTRMSSNASLIRLQSDWKNMENDPPEGCSAAPVDDSDLYVWNATMIGPENTPWEGGFFTLRLTFSEAYPTKAPKVRFISKMFHPNIYKGNG